MKNITEIYSKCSANELQILTLPSSWQQLHEFHQTASRWLQTCTCHCISQGKKQYPCCGIPSDQLSKDLLKKKYECKYIQLIALL